MVLADSNRVELRYIAESQWGSAPTSGTTRALRFTGESLEYRKNTTTSNEIRSDRMVPAIIETEAMSNGAINYEFSAGSHDDFFAGFLMGSWSRPMTYDSWKGTQVSWTANNKIAIAAATTQVPYFTVGRRIKTEGFINPLNNGFFQISSVALVSGVTEVTVSTTTSVVETGNVYVKLMDANDVIVMNNTAIRCGTSSASSFDSNGGNAFASAIAAGQIVVGQKLHFEGLGYEAGSYAIGATLAAQTFTLNDGTNSITLTAGTDFAVGASAADSATNLAAAINAARVNGFGGTYINMKATVATATVTVTNLNMTGGSLAKANDSGPDVTLTALSGGNASASGVFTVTSATDDAIYVTPAPPTINNSTIAVTVRGSMIRNPGNPANIVEQSYSIEKYFGDAGKSMIFDGQEVGEFSLDVSSGAIMTGSFNFMGRATTSYGSGTKFGTSPFTALETTATEPLNATTNVGTVVKNGATLGVYLQSIKLDGKGGLANRMAVGNKYPIGIRQGRFTLSGSMTAYFSTFEMWDHFKNHDTISLSFPFNDHDKNHYEFTLPAIKLTADPMNARGIDQDVQEEITWEAQRDAITDSMIQIDRFSSLKPVGS